LDEGKHIEAMLFRQSQPLTHYIRDKKDLWA